MTITLAFVFTYSLIVASFLTIFMFIELILVNKKLSRLNNYFKNFYELQNDKANKEEIKKSQ